MWNGGLITLTVPLSDTAGLLGARIIQDIFGKLCRLICHLGISLRDNSTLVLFPYISFSHVFFISYIFLQKIIHSAI